MKYAGLIFDHSPHYLDHLAPFCALLNWPLLICDSDLAETCRKFYPQVHCIEVDFFKLDLPPCIVTCYPKPMIQAALGIFRPYRGKVLWLPHGLSDKGWKSPFFEALNQEDLLLVYGQRMRDVLAKKKIQLPNVSVGNFRREFYLQNKAFYDGLVIGNQLPGNDRSILYAPTWEDAENNGSFWEAFPMLVEQIPEGQSLLIKVHPNTLKKYQTQLDKLKTQHSNAVFLNDFPPIHPLLNRADAYLGDMSSIGYDFLSYNRPLFFLTKQKKNPSLDPSAHLMQAGTQITLSELSLVFRNKDPVNHQALNAHAFDPCPAFDQIENTLASILEKA